jgi:hypothetical protein
MSSAICTSYLRERFEGLHGASDVYKVALYTAGAELDSSTTKYSSTDEVSGPGYTAGGQVMVGFVTGADGKTAWANWNSDPAWPNSSISARYALIYNSSKGNRAVVVLDFGTLKISSNGTFRIMLPPPGAESALIRTIGP